MDAGHVQPAEEPDGATKGAEMAVRVAVRARPLLAQEGMQGCKDCVKVLHDSNQILLGRDRPFTFDHVFDTTTTQEEVYRECVKPLVESCIAGYNTTVLAYGQTGSGKTFTMGTSNSSYVLDEELGVLPRAIRHLFDCVEASKVRAEFLIRCSFVEIYNEEIKDLLHPDGKQIAIREDASGGIVLAGVREEVVNCYDDMLRYLETGSVSRTTGSTLMNQQSSRSHAIFTIIVEQRLLSDENQSGAGSDYITAKFHLVDLAGSERNKRTGAVGVRFKESVQINCGLLALGNVISALGDDKKRVTHVPYRESKLTRMLQDSLGGNSRTCMIACISTADVNFEETLNTLKYANRARNIKNKPIINRDPQQALLAQMRSEIQALQMEIMRHRGAAGGGAMPPANASGTLPESELPLGEIGRDLHMVHERSLRAEQDCRRLKEELEKSQASIQKLTDESLEVRTERDHYQMRLDEVNTELSRLLESVPRWEEAGEIGPAAKQEVQELHSRLNSNWEAEPREAPGNAPSPRPASPKGKAGRLSDREGGDSRLGSRPSSPGKLRRQNSKERDKLPSPRGPPGSHFSEPPSPPVKNLRNSGPRNMINQYLRTIKDLEEKLATKDKELKARDDALAEATEDLARDELIFAEKMKEIKAVKKLARDLTRAKEELTKQAERDGEAIALLKMELRHQDAEVARLREDLGRSEGSGSKSTGGASLEPRTPSCVPDSAAPQDRHEVRSSTEEEDDEVKYQDDGSLSPMGAQASGAVEEDSEEGRRIAALAEKIKAEDDETERILAAKTSIEAEKRRLEEIALAQQQDYKRQKAIMDKQLRDLAYNISEKEDLIQQLAKNEQEAKLLSLQYEARMWELEREVKQKEAEIDQLRHDLESIDNNLAKGAEEKRRLREQYEEKVRRAQQQVLVLKRQQKDNEKNKLERLKAKSDQKAQQLGAEVVRMRSQHDALRRRMEELSEKYEEKNRGHMKDIVNLKKEAEVSQKKVRELESEKSKLNAILQRKSEEMAAAQRKLRELGADAEVFKRERSALYAAGRTTPRTSRRVSRAGDSVPSTPSMTPRVGRPGKNAGITAMEIKRHHANLDKEMEKMLKHKELAVGVAKKEKKRQEVLAERDELVNDRSKLELKKMRAHQVLSKQVEEKGAAMAQLRENMEQRHMQAREAEAVGQFKAADELKDQAAACQRQLEYEHYYRTGLEEQLQSQKYLPQDEEETLAAIEERLEVLDAEAEYLAAEIAQVQKEASAVAPAAEALKGAVDAISLPEMKVLLRGYLQRVVDGQEKEREAHATLRRLEMEVADKAGQLQQVESSLRTKEMDFDRRLTEEQKAHAAKVQFLLRQIKSSANVFPERDSPDPNSQATGRRSSTERQPDFERGPDDKDEKVQALIKDNFYFKQTNRELKRKLRDMMASLAAERQDIKNNATQASELQRVQQELENCKSVLHRAGLNYQVPAMHLRELSNGDLEARMSSQIHGNFN